MLRRSFHRRTRRARRPVWRRLLDIAMAAFFLGGAAVIAAKLGERSAETLEGSVRVIDGDSLALGERRLRLKGIDAPELRQTCLRGKTEYACGQNAANHLRALIGPLPVRCLTEGIDRYRRDLVRCEAGRVDLNATMVLDGQAVGYGDYGPQEEAARSARRGLWSGTFERPKEWRAVHGGLDEPLHDGLMPLVSFLRRLFGI